MRNHLANAAIVLALLLFAVALISMANGSLMVAGFCFLSASIVIYFRETRLLEA